VQADVSGGIGLNNASNLSCRIQLFREYISTRDELMTPNLRAGGLCLHAARKRREKH
jgi:hypothetical protein